MEIVLMICLVVTVTTVSIAIFVLLWITINVLLSADVVKKNGRWVYNKDFKAGEFVEVPIECIMNVQKKQEEG
ncbi:hypothetical protein KKI24_22630 [bacterium]|nr:hypothetical protein [bacterium]